MIATGRIAGKLDKELAIVGRRYNVKTLFKWNVKAKSEK